MTKKIGIRQAVKAGYIEMEVGGVADFLYPTSTLRRGRVQGGGTISPTITAENTGVCKVEKNEMYDGMIHPTEDVREESENDSEINWNETEYRIRKLTPREVGRLMDVSDSDIDKILSVNSNTQAYKEFGNSIVVSVLCAVYSQLNIQGITPWNERTEQQKEELISYHSQKS